MQGRMLSRMQSGLWDRLLALPSAFFHRYSVADLTQRAAGVEMIQQIIAQVASQTLFALVTLVFSAALLFVYNSRVAAIVLVVTLLVVIVGVAVTWAQIQRLRGMYEARGQTSGILLQIVQGIDKVRAAAAESRALDQWSRRFAKQVGFLLSAQRLSAVRSALYGALPVVLTLTVFTVVGADPGLMSTSAFLAFIAALGQIASATAQLDLTLGYILNIVPLFDRMRPILEEGVEVVAGASDPGPLSGHVALNNVSFRYPGMSSPVLQDIDLTVQPGEFLAIVGPSGCGKSTMIRLLLGFERPEAGTVTYDSKDLQSLDVRAVRAQLSVAMQNGAVTGNDILSVIRGDRPLTEDEVWEAAEQVGIAEDIRKLPMGMRTMIGDNAVTFSGGQRQRLVLAAAVARRPRIVILDEATSALDSVTQAHVVESFGRLRVTRVVIAHRLSTIRQADRLVVLDQGRIVQQGSYQELAEIDGPFRTMVRRQGL
jgi:ATP-binding cassette subfamily C protein